MKKQFPIMLNSPPKGATFGVLVWMVFCFVLLPTWTVFFMYGLWDDLTAMSWCEIVFNGANIFIIGFLYKDYFGESVFEAKLMWREIARMVAVCAAVIVGLYLCIFEILSLFAPDWLVLMWEGMIPISVSDIYLTAGATVYGNPLFGSLCMVLVAPFITCGFFYASTFAPVCCNHPWLGYGAMALVLAIPRVGGALLYDNAAMPVALYFAQLPVHMISCWVYQKTDNVWAPIALHMLLNLIGCALILVTGYVL